MFYVSHDQSCLLTGVCDYCAEIPSWPILWYMPDFVIYHVRCSGNTWGNWHYPFPFLVDMKLYVSHFMYLFMYLIEVPYSTW